MIFFPFSNPARFEKEAERVKAVAISSSQARAQSIALVFAFSILMGLLARVAVPLPFTPVPVTGQTLGVLLAGVVLGGPRAAAAMLLYLAQGAAGLPVFSPAGPGGLAHLLGPTGGYLLSYPLAAFVVGWLAEPRRIRWLGLPALLAGEAVIFTMGAAWVAVLSQQPSSTVLSAAVWPFLPGEVIKVGLVFALSALLGRRLRGESRGSG